MKIAAMPWGCINGQHQSSCKCYFCCYNIEYGLCWEIPEQTVLPDIWIQQGMDMRADRCKLLPYNSRWGESHPECIWQYRTRVMDSGHFYRSRLMARFGDINTSRSVCALTLKLSRVIHSQYSKRWFLEVHVWFGAGFRSMRGWYLWELHVDKVMTVCQLVKNERRGGSVSVKPNHESLRI